MRKITKPWIPPCWTLHICVSPSWDTPNWANFSMFKGGSYSFYCQSRQQAVYKAASILKTIARQEARNKVEISADFMRDEPIPRRMSDIFHLRSSLKKKPSLIAKAPVNKILFKGQMFLSRKEKGRDNALFVLKI